MEDEKSRSYFEKELKKIKPCDAKETEVLLAKKEEEGALTRLVEGHLWKLVSAAALYETDKVRFMDLIQEGSMALADFFRERDEIGENFEGDMEKAVVKAMEAFSKEENQSFRAGEELVQKLNAIDFFATKIAEEKGREATKEELALLMNTSTEEVENLLKIALEILEGDHR